MHFSLVLSVKPFFLFLIESRLHSSELNSLFQKFCDYSFHYIEAVGRVDGLILG